MTIEEQKSKVGKLLQVFIVTLFLVIMPIVTFLVQRRGMIEGKELYKDLKNNLGQIPLSFNAVNYSNEHFDSGVLKGQTLVVSWATTQSRDSILSVMHTIDRVSQFQEEVDNLQFITFDTSSDSLFFKKYYFGLSKNEREKWLILRGGDDVKQSIKLPNDYSVALIDTSGVVRRFYDIRQAQERKLLVEHISIMPLRKKKTIEKKEQKQM